MFWGYALVWTRPMLARDLDVCLGPPCAAKVRHVQIASKIVPAPARLQDDVVIFPGYALLVHNGGFGRVGRDLVAPATKRTGRTELGMRVAKIGLPPHTQAGSAIPMAVVRRTRI